MDTEILFNWKTGIGLLFIFFILSLVILLLIVPAKMANKRGRSGLFWFLFSLIISPFLSMLFLYFLGETDDKRKERIIEEERLRNLYRNPNFENKKNSENDLENWLKNNPNKTLNDYYNR